MQQAAKTADLAQQIVAVQRGNSAKTTPVLRRQLVATGCAKRHRAKIARHALRTVAVLRASLANKNNALRSIHAGMEPVMRQKTRTARLVPSTVLVRLVSPATRSADRAKIPNLRPSPHPKASPSPHPKAAPRVLWTEAPKAALNLPRRWGKPQPNRQQTAQQANRP